MWDWINWGEVETAELDSYEAAYISLIFFIVYFVYEGNISNAIGLSGLFLALHSIRSSSKQLKDVQLDYWNARGIDHNRNGLELYLKRDYDNAILAYENAIDAFDKAYLLDPLYSKSWTNKGNALLSLGKYDKAIDAFRQALDLSPKSPRTWTNIGRAFLAKGQAFSDQNNFLSALVENNRALEAFDIAINQDTELSRSWNNKGAALKSKGDILRKQGDEVGFEPFMEGLYIRNIYDEAVRCYNEAIRLNQNFGSYWYNKAVALDANGNYEDAIQTYDTAIN
jgi:tetratricopeptide (TPR) repeat protein